MAPGKVLCPCMCPYCMVSLYNTYRPHDVGPAVRDGKPRDYSRPTSLTVQGTITSTLAQWTVSTVCVVS